MLERLMAVLGALSLILLSILTEIGLTQTVKTNEDADDHFPSFEGAPPPLNHLPPFATDPPSDNADQGSRTGAPSTDGFEVLSISRKQQTSTEFEKNEGASNSSRTRGEGHPLWTEQTAEVVTTYLKEDQEDSTEDIIMNDDSGSTGRTPSFVLVYTVFTTLAVVLQR